MFNFILWPSNIIFLLCVHVLEKKKNWISARKGNATKEGQVFESGNAPSPCPRQHSLSHCCTGCACRAPRPCWGQEPSLGPPGSTSLALAAVSELPESTNQVLFLLGCFSAVPPCRGLRGGAAPVVTAGSRGDGVTSAPCVSHPKVTWLLSLGAVRWPRVGCIQRRRRAREAQGWCL